MRRKIPGLAAASTCATAPTAFVLAGGGSLSTVQTGMLAELVAAGERPDMIVGVSAGALNGGFFAYEPGITMIQKMDALCCAITTRQALGLSLRSVLGFLGLRGLRDHIASPLGLRTLLETHLPYRQFAQAAIPLHIVCSELVTGREVVLSAGTVIDAILASDAIPGVFPPVAIAGELLVDGGVAANTPIATAISLLGARQLLQDFDRHSATTAIHVVPTLCPAHHSSYDYSHGTDLIARARESTRAWIASGGLTRREFPPQLLMHAH